MYLCNCRAISSKSLDRYLDGQTGTVRLKEAMDACSNGAQCCRAHAESCAMAVQRRIDIHNGQAKPDAEVPATIAPQSPSPKDPVC